MQYENRLRPPTNISLFTDNLLQDVKIIRTPTESGTFVYSMTENREVLWTEDLEISPAKFTIGAGQVIPWEEAKTDLYNRLEYHSKLPIPHLPELEPHPGRCIIVGSSPGVTEQVGEIQKARQGDYDIIASLNGAHDFLIKNGVVPNIHPLWEYDTPDLRVLGGKPHEGVRYYLCSQTPTNIYPLLKDYKCVLWHVYNEPPDYQNWIRALYPKEFMVGGAHATLFRTLSLSVILGYREFEIYGCDSSFDLGGDDHVGGYLTPSNEDEVDVWGYNPTGAKVKKFRTVGSLAFTARLFIEFCGALHPALKIRVHGNGLLRYLHEARYPDMYQPQGTEGISH
jgi:hypothetical protein